jgi:hypothetical protein
MRGRKETRKRKKSKEEEASEGKGTKVGGLGNLAMEWRTTHGHSQVIGIPAS